MSCLMYLLVVFCHVKYTLNLACRTGECNINRHRLAVSGSIRRRFFGELEVHQQLAEEGSSLPPCEWVSFNVLRNYNFETTTQFVCHLCKSCGVGVMTVICYSKADLLSWLTKTCYLGKSSESVQWTCWGPVTHAQACAQLIQYSAVYRFGSLSVTYSASLFRGRLFIHSEP